MLLPMPKPVRRLVLVMVLLLVHFLQLIGAAFATTIGGCGGGAAA